MSATWPAALPQKFLLGTRDERQAATVRFTVDAGPAKTRRAFSNVARRVNWSLAPLTQTQRDALDVFHNTTLAEGSLPFDFADPGTGLVAQWRFLAPPAYSASANRNGKLWIVDTLQMEILP